jgi:hypothetical protein
VRAISYRAVGDRDDGAASVVATVEQSHFRICIYHFYSFTLFVVIGDGAS